MHILFKSKSQIQSDYSLFGFYCYEAKKTPNKQQQTFRDISCKKKTAEKSVLQTTNANAFSAFC